MDSKLVFVSFLMVVLHHGVLAFQIEQIKEIAKFLRLFQEVKRTGLPSTEVFTGFLKLLGLDDEKLNAVTVNGFAFLAQMLGSSLLPPSTETPENLENFEFPTERALPDFLIDYVRRKSEPGDTQCVQLLICKLSPFILQTQTIFQREILQTPAESKTLLELPSIEDLLHVSDKCDKTHYCAPFKNDMSK